MKFNSLWLLLGMFFWFESANAQAPEKWSLEKCINYALENNIQAVQAGINSKLAGIDNLQSKLNVLPTLDANANFLNNIGNGFNPQTFSFSQGNSQSLQLQLTGNLPLFTGLQQIYNAERAKFEFMAAKYDYQATENTVALNVASAYLQTLLNKEIEKVAEKQKELSEAQKTIIQNRIAAGSLPESAIYDIESQIGRDEVSIVNAKNAINLSLLTIAQLLQVKDPKNFDIDAPEVTADNMGDIASVSAEGVYNYALGNQPTVKGPEARVRSSMSQRKMSYGALSPTLSAFFGLSTGYFSQDKKIIGQNIDSVSGGGTAHILGADVPFDYKIGVPLGYQYGSIPLSEELHNNLRGQVGLTLDIPLFSKGQKILNIQKADLTVRLRQLQLDAAKNQLRQDIEQAYANAKAAAESYMANNKSLEAAQKAYQAIESRYKAGMASNFDMQQSQNNLIAAQSQMAQAKYTFVFRMKILDFYQGKPIKLN